LTVPRKPTDFKCAGCGKETLRDWKDDYMLTHVKWQEVCRYYNSDPKAVVCYGCMMRAITPKKKDFTLCLSFLNRAVHEDRSAVQIATHMHGERDGWTQERIVNLVSYIDGEIAKAIIRQARVDFQADWLKLSEKPKGDPTEKLNSLDVTSLT
jgi:hypothetical protein